MSSSMHDLGIDRLSLEDRLGLVDEIWESVSRELESESLTAPQRQELERRLADSLARPEAVTSWEVVKARALARARR